MGGGASRVGLSDFIPDLEGRRELISGLLTQPDTTWPPRAAIRRLIEIALTAKTKRQSGRGGCAERHAGKSRCSVQSHEGS